MADEPAQPGPDRLAPARCAVMVWPPRWITSRQAPPALAARAASSSRTESRVVRR